jgi:ATP-dependent Clp protease adaptor protein ClpS
MNPFEWEAPEKAEVVVDQDVNKIVVFNDDVNTFEHVIQTFVEVLRHTYEQADQCAHIIHYIGKCSVKEGNFDELVPLRNAICNRGISAEVM